ncbi:MAG: DUF1080 domain-containing protein [Verrucomicrobia subdivision 3 bacterium]|nr:DUF1080 domain-containing protein [Limisphaerales bacterium]
MKPLVLFLISISIIAAPSDKAVFATPEAAADNPDFAIQGEYKGDGIDGNGKNIPAGVQIVALGKGEFSATVFQGGLPGDGWNKDTKWTYTGKRRGEDKAVFKSEETMIVLYYNNGNILAAKGDRKVGQFKKITRKSPTLSAKPPKGAVVLFNGKDTGKLAKPRITDDGLLMEGVMTKDAYQDFTLHLEFRLPFMPAARGQARANSGVYLQRRYETQILDSFGLEQKHNDCGGIYRQRAANLNMCFPPLTWQTYDIDFTAARFDDDGKKTKGAMITVKLNGVIIHDAYELKNKTGAGQKEGPAPLPILLQNHGNPVRFRNYWILKK